MRPIFHPIELRVKSSHLCRGGAFPHGPELTGRRLKEAGVDVSPERAMEALSTVRLVSFRLEGQPERRGGPGGCPDARLVLKSPENSSTSDHRRPPEGGNRRSDGMPLTIRQCGW